MAKCRGGNHRLAIAKVLELSEIPVLVRVRHSVWQQIRDEVRKADSLYDLDYQTRSHLSHPDLIDIRSPK